MCTACASTVCACDGEITGSEYFRANISRNCLLMKLFEDARPRRSITPELKCSAKFHTQCMIVSRRRQFISNMASNDPENPFEEVICLFLHWSPVHSLSDCKKILMCMSQKPLIDHSSKDSIGINSNVIPSVWTQRPVDSCFPFQGLDSELNLGELDLTSEDFMLDEVDGEFGLKGLASFPSRPDTVFHNLWLLNCKSRPPPQSKPKDPTHTNTVHMCTDQQHCDCTDPAVRRNAAGLILFNQTDCSPTPTPLCSQHASFK